MGFAVRLILLSYRRLYLVSCPSLSVLRPFVGGGDLVRPPSVSWAEGGFNTPSQVARYLVAGMLTGVVCGEYICASDGTVTFGWMMFGEIIGQVVLSSFPIQEIVSLSYSIAHPIESHVNCS